MALENAENNTDFPSQLLRNRKTEGKGGRLYGKIDVGGWIKGNWALLAWFIGIFIWPSWLRGIYGRGSSV